MMERRPAMLVPAHARLQEGRRPGNHRPHIVCAIKRDGRPEVERGSMGKKVIGYILSNSLEACRPTKDADLVVVSLADRGEPHVRGRKSCSARHSAPAPAKSLTRCDAQSVLDSRSHLR